MNGLSEIRDVATAVAALVLAAAAALVLLSDPANKSSSAGVLGEGIFIPVSVVSGNADAAGWRPATRKPALRHPGYNRGGAWRPGGYRPGGYRAPGRTIRPLARRVISRGAGPRVSPR